MYFLKLFCLPFYRYFYVVAIEDGKEESRLSFDFKNIDLVTYSEAMSSVQPIPYIAAVMSHRNFKFEFMLGDGENTSLAKDKKTAF